MKLACLIQNHRRKFLRENIPDSIDDNPETIKRLCVLLRLAVLMNRSRFNTALPDIRIKVDKSLIKLKFPEDWLETHPLTHADLDTENNYLTNAGFTFKYQ